MLVRQVIQDETGMSRRQCFSLFQDRKVKLNGSVCDNFTTTCQTGDHIQRQSDRGSREATVSSDDVTPMQVIMFHKPVGCVVARSDRFSQTIYDVLPVEFRQHFRYVGRLDGDSSGLLLLTNDGDLVHQLTHPRFHVPKTYRVGLNKSFDAGDVDRLLSGEMVGMYDTQDNHVDKLSVSAIDGVGSQTVSVTLTEGKKRHIRRLFRHIGYRVRTLQRTAMGPLSLESLQPGAYRFLSSKEIALVREAIRHASKKR